uniref:Protein kinase domain-containing protein n=1 Tax=Neogobius melanostomus TaxID=47308 RepID=A0A8C6SGA9_9GOBI
MKKQNKTQFSPRKCIKVNPFITFPLKPPRSKQLKKLSEDSLTKQPEEVFDVLEKLGEGESYGCVFKAHYKETGEIVAIKQVPVESDLQEIIKEISIMQQCNRYRFVLSV